MLKIKLLKMKIQEKYGFDQDKISFPIIDFERECYFFIYENKKYVPKDYYKRRILEADPKGIQEPHPLYMQEFSREIQKEYGEVTPANGYKYLIETEKQVKKFIEKDITKYDIFPKLLKKTKDFYIFEFFPVQDFVELTPLILSKNLSLFNKTLKAYSDNNVFPSIDIQDWIFNPTEKIFKNIDIEGLVYKQVSTGFLKDASNNIFIWDKKKHKLEEFGEYNKIFDLNKYSKLPDSILKGIINSKKINPRKLPIPRDNYNRIKELLNADSIS